MYTLLKSRSNRPAEDARWATITKEVNTLLTDNQRFNIEESVFDTQNEATRQEVLFKTVSSGVSKNEGITTFNTTNNIKHKLKVYLYNYIDLQLIKLWLQRLFGVIIFFDWLEEYKQNIVYNGKRSGFELSTYLWISTIFENLAAWNNLNILSEPSFWQARFAKHNAVLYDNLAGHHNPKSLPRNLKREPLADAHLLSQTASPTPSNGQELWVMAGTLGAHYGILDGIAYSKCNLDGRPHILLIIGHSPDKKFAAVLEDACRNIPHIILILAPQYLPPRVVSAAISAADLLLLPYRISPATINRTPVKLIEAANYGTPVRIPANPAWVRLCRMLGIPFSHFDATLAPLRSEGIQYTPVATIVSWQQAQLRSHLRLAFAAK